MYLVSSKFKFQILYCINTWRDESWGETGKRWSALRYVSSHPSCRTHAGDLKGRERWLILISHAIGKVISASVFGLQAKGTFPDWIRIVPQGLAEFWTAGTPPGDGQLRVHRKNGTMEKNMLQMVCVATINNQFHAEHCVRKHWTPRVVMMPTLSSFATL